MTAGVVVVLFAGYQLFGTGIAEARSQRQLGHQFARAVGAPPSVSAGTVRPLTVPVPTPAVTVAAPAPPTGEAVAHLVIPKIGVDDFVVGGVGVADLRKGPGHYPQTPLPGQRGNAAIAGHRTTYGAPFYRLNELQPGDDIYVTTVQGRFHYIVATTEIVKPTEVSVLAPTLEDHLTLTTCNPRFSAATRLVVVSRLTGTVTPSAAPVPPTRAVRPTSAAASDDPTLAVAPATAAAKGAGLGAGDAAAWPPTLLFGALTLLAWVGVRMGGARARRPVPVYLLGAALCLVPLWLLFANATRLIPPGV
jgi:sortase A